MDSICDVWLRSGYNFDALDMLDKINGIVSLEFRRHEKRGVLDMSLYKPHILL